MSEYPDENNPGFKISLDFAKTFYKIGNDWVTDFNYEVEKTLELMMKLEKISNGVATFRSYRIIRDKHNFEVRDW